MKWSDERAAFEMRVSDNFETVRVQYPGTALKPAVSSTEAWVKMQLLSGSTDRVSLGPNGMFRSSGIVLFMIYAPTGASTKLNRSIADELSDLFHEAEFTYADSGHIRCYAGGLDDRGLTPDGNWYQLNLRFEYQRDVFL